MYTNIFYVFIFVIYHKFKFRKLLNTDFSYSPLKYNSIFIAEIFDTFVYFS